MSNKILRLNAVIDKTGLSRSNIYLLVSKGEFPKQVKLSPRCAGWVEAEVEQWLTDRIKSNDRITLKVNGG